MPIPGLSNPVITRERISARADATDHDQARDPLHDFVGGTPGDDNLLGTAGDDTIFAQAGNDFVRAFAGNDFVHGHAGDDYLRGDTGDDSLHGDEDDDYIRGGADDDIMFGGDGLDRAAFFGAATGVHVSLLLQGGPQDTGDGIDWLYEFEHLSGTKHDDSLIGDAGDNWLWGDVSGEDTPTGGGNDSLYGGDGDDLLDAGTGNHVLFGQSGFDSVTVFGNGTDTLGAVKLDLNIQSGFAQDTGQGIMHLKGIENLSGSIHGDELIGNDKGNILAGRDGDDQLVGNGGADQLWGDGAVRINAPVGTSGDIILETQSLDLDGNNADGDDVISGNGGADFILGGNGGDTLSGGSGHDTFHYSMIEDSLFADPDLILDCRTTDTINIKDIDGDVSTLTNEDFSFVGSFTGTAAEAVLKYVAGEDRTYLFLDDDGDASADGLIVFEGRVTGAFDWIGVS